MRHKSLITLFFFILFSTFISAQVEEDETTIKISSIFNNYFELEREAIHLHLNKTDYLTNESIWFKGYVVNRKTNGLFYSTNIFVVLYDENGVKIDEQLALGSIGFFQGDFTLKKSYKSGRYYIQAYTNWMNNFSENESVIREINIINPSEGYKNYDKLDYETLSIKINPEGGKMIKNISNSIGVEVSDCIGNRISDQELRLVNESGIQTATLKLNKFGLGKITIPYSEEKIKFTLSTSNREVSKQLPDYEQLGININVNTSFNDSYIIIKLTTNSFTKNHYKDKKLKLIIQQDEKILDFDLVFNENNEITFQIENKILFNGINTVRIIDADLNEVASRLFYNHGIFKQSLLVNSYKKSENEFILNGQFDIKKEAVISVSCLPMQSKSNSLYVPIIAGLRINPYLEKPLKNAYYYFENFNRAKKYELDLEMVNQSVLKYRFNELKLHPPKSNFTFDIGLQLTGKIPANYKTTDQYKVKAFSYVALISKLSDVNEKSEYLIENLVPEDSTFVDVSLVKFPNLNKAIASLTPVVGNRNRPFYKKFIPYYNQKCKVNSELIAYDLPTFTSDVISLKEVIVEGKAQDRLKYNSQFGNGYLRSFKITENDHSLTLLQFIERNGFAVTNNLGNITISNRTARSSSINAAVTTAAIFIDNREIFNTVELNGIQMHQIDEIYLSPNAIVPGLNNKNGVIKIYLNAIQFKREDGFKYLIEKGFKKIASYKPADYFSTTSDGFKNYGVIGWLPNLFINKEGAFNVTVDDYKINETKIIIEGFTIDEEIIYHEKTVKFR